MDEPTVEMTRVAMEAHKSLLITCVSIGSTYGQKQPKACFFTKA